MGLKGARARLDFLFCHVQACKVEAQRLRVEVQEIVWEKVGKYQGWGCLHHAAQNQGFEHVPIPLLALPNVLYNTSNFHWEFFKMCNVVACFPL